LIKTKVLNAVCYGTFEDFKRMADNCASELDGKHKKKTAFLISEFLRTFRFSLMFLYRSLNDVFLPKAAYIP
jgi:hypothetical protein